MKHRKEELKKLIGVYYAAARLEHGWYSEGRDPQKNRLMELFERRS